MKASELRNLIREEVRKVLSEDPFYDMHSKNPKYKKIFSLIDLSNGPGNAPGKESAEKELIKMKVYNNSGELATKDRVIRQYYETNWT